MHLSILTILLAALSCLSAFGFQPDSNTKAYKATVDQLLSNSATFAPPVDPGPPNYWFHPKIHTFGNHGVLGAVHATVAPLATKLIDVVAYEGENVRNQICQRLQEERVSTNEPRIVDLACGVGMSTRALQKSFPFAKQIVGLDTSPEMIHMAKAYTDPTSIPSKAMDIVTKVLYQVKGLHGPALPETSATSTVPPTDYLQANAEDTGLEKASVDLVTIMYCFHEAPYLGRARILREAHRLLTPKATLCIVDISPSYEPSLGMLAGEPYVLEYQENIQLQLARAPGFANCQYQEIVPGHVGLWLLERDESMAV